MYTNPMSRQVESLPELIESQYEDLEPKARARFFLFRKFLIFRELS